MNDQDQKPEATRNWGKIFLILSLALNLLFVGAIVGAGWMRHKYASSSGGPPDFVINRMLRHLPDQKQKSIRDLLASHRQDRRPRFKAIRGQMRALKQVLKGEPFDAEKVRRMAQGLHQVRGQLIEGKTELLIKVFQQVTPEERRELLNNRMFRRMFAHGGRRPFRRHWRGRHNGE